MAKDLELRQASGIADRIFYVAIALGVLAVLGLIASAMYPFDTDVEANLPAARSMWLEPLPAKQSIADLNAKLAGRCLIRPAQVQAAVKDSGVAAKLAKQLKLQGIIRLRKDLVAYIRVKNRGVESVRSGEKILEFVVQSIAPGVVTLTLDGVTVHLRS